MNWIPVSERLPEGEAKAVLVYVPNHNPRFQITTFLDMTHIEGYDVCGFCGDAGDILNINESDFNKDVTHWAEITPPKGDE